VIGIDPGTISVDLCGLDDGRLFLDESIPTADALANPDLILGILHRAAPLDLVVGPSGYGLPLANVREITDSDMRLVCLAPRGEGGGIGGLSSLMRALAKAPVTVIVTPGVVHLESVPEHRKINRVDMGTADKVCAVALAIHQQARRQGCREQDVSLILLELGGAFTAAIAVEHGRIVDGLGGSSGPLGAAAGGALDGEVTHARATALAAYLESAVKAVAAMAVSAPSALEVVLSGRLARVVEIREALANRLSRVVGGGRVDALSGFAAVAKHAAQGAALLADGLAGGTAAPLVEALRIRKATGTVLDHLYVISPRTARQRLGIE
jgi:predicted butyrate kinase (DUF1464 family)